MATEQKRGEIKFILEYHTPNEILNPKIWDGVIEAGRLYLEFFIPASYHDEILQELRNANKGILPPKEKLELADLRLKNMFYCLSYLWQKGHQIEIYIEPPPSDKFTEETENLQNESMLAKRYIVSDLEKAINIQTEFADKWAECNRIRDNNMAAHIAEVYAKASYKNMVVICGAAHKCLTNRLNLNDIPTEIIAQPSEISSLLKYFQMCGYGIKVAPKEKRELMLKELVGCFISAGLSEKFGEEKDHLIEPLIDKFLNTINERVCCDMTDYLKIQAIRFYAIATRPPSLEESAMFAAKWFEENTNVDLSTLKT